MEVNGGEMEVHGGKMEVNGGKMEVNGGKCRTMQLVEDSRRPRRGEQEVDVATIPWDSNGVKMGLKWRENRLNAALQREGGALVRLCPNRQANRGKIEANGGKMGVKRRGK